MIQVVLLMALPGRLRSRRKRFRWPKREASGTRKDSTLAKQCSQVTDTANMNRLPLQTLLKGMIVSEQWMCEYHRIDATATLRNFFPCKLFTSVLGFVFLSASNRYQHGLNIRIHSWCEFESRCSPSACGVPRCSIPHAHLHRVPSPGNEETESSYHSYPFLRIRSSISLNSLRVPFLPHATKAWEGPNIVSMLQAVRRPLKPSQSLAYWDPSGRAVECNSTQQRIASKGQRMQHSIAAKQLVTTHEPAKIQWRVPARFAAQSTSLKEGRPQHLGI